MTKSEAASAASPFKMLPMTACGDRRSLVASAVDFAADVVEHLGAVTVQIR
jgi:hypothetical protein